MCIFILQIFALIGDNLISYQAISGAFSEKIFNYNLNIFIDNILDVKRKRMQGKDVYCFFEKFDITKNLNQ